VNQEPLKLVIVGHVDHGKSTLVGRLFHDTDSLPEGKLAQIEALCKKRGMKFEWSFLMDALQTERDQGITIDTSRIWFKHKTNNYVIIDAPGHREFLKNMVTGAAGSDAALLLVDAEEGVREQTRRHGYLLHLLGVRQILVLINKMDKVGYAQARFEEVAAECRAYLQSIAVEPSAIIPISAQNGDMVVKRGDNLAWYCGQTLLENLEKFSVASPLDKLPLRLPVQDVYRFDDRRIIVGRIESGALQVGDTILLSPSNHAAKIKTIVHWPESEAPTTCAKAGECVGITLEDQFFVERGNLISNVEDAPILTRTIKARIFWLGQNELQRGAHYKMRINTAELNVLVKDIVHVIDTQDLAEQKTDMVLRNQVAEVILQVRGLAAVDDFSILQQTGRFVLIDGYDIAGGGIINLTDVSDQRVTSKNIKSRNIHGLDIKITAEQRAAQNGHKGGILWFTGLSGSGKSTIAQELQLRLFAKNYQVYVLDGDNIRQGLNADLGFSPEDRAENIRRVGEVAALFAQAGFIVISAFISPYREDRRRARMAAPEFFHNIYIKAGLEVCEQRDVKGLYKKARAGEIAEFTGISAPYEAPENPDLLVDTVNFSVDECVEQLVAYVDEMLVG